jgi:protease-4
MKGFFKTFFAALLALIIFSVLGIMILVGFIAAASTSDKPVIGSNAVLVLDLSNVFKEQSIDNPFNAFINKKENDIPSLYDMIRMIHHAKTDSAVKGIYIMCANNPNGFGSSEELRKALVDFKTSKKFVVAYGETITQKGYYVGSAADKIYCHPIGGLEWSGFVSNLYFLKGLLDKLEIQPQIFYAGKFKSATEPLREYQMTDANRLQTSVWLGDLYTHFLAAVATTRHLDTAKIRALAEAGSIQTAHDAYTNGLVDGLFYDDELRAYLNKQLKATTNASINFVHFGEYAKSVDFKQEGSGKMAIIYAEGDIVSGEGDNEQIGSDHFRTMIRKARLDKDIKAIVLRVNSPGGSSLASEVIWREIALARQEKPVVVSMGDVAASGGYYISCNADSVFANENTITGSIGVFSIVPNLASFFKNKLYISFDRVKTAPFADMGSSDRPLTETEKKFFQAGTDSIYLTFKTRVSKGRKKELDAVDSIAQGRVWTGARAIGAGLVDRIGTLQDAVNCAAKMSKLTDYTLKEYPEKKNILDQLMSTYKKSIKKDLIEEELGKEPLLLLKQMKQMKEMVGIPQTRLPFMVAINN